MGTRKKNKPVEPIVRVELPPVVEPAAVEPLERLRVAVLNRLAEKFENRKLKINLADLNAAIQLLKKAGSPLADGREVPAAPGGAQGVAEDGSGSREDGVLPPPATEDTPAGQQKTSWSPMDTHERAAVDLPFLPFTDGKHTPTAGG